MSWFLTILFLSLTFGTNLLEANHDNKKLLPSPIVVGTVYCDTCFQQAFSLNSHFISGASIAVECKIGKTKPRFYKEVKTNEHGEFKVKLPFLVKKHVKRIKGCSFKLLSSNEPNCAIASTSTSTSFSLSLKKKLQQEHIFSAGIFSFKPTKKPKFCDQKHSTHQNLKKQLGHVKNFDQSKFSKKKKVPHHEIKDFFFPPNPLLPPPIIPNPFFPPNPLFPPPIIPNPFFPPLIPNPLQPPPLIPNPLQPPPLIPNPFQPPSPPLIPNPLQPPPLIPNPFQPPSPPLIPNPFQPPSPPPLIPNPFQPPSPPPLIPNPFQPPPSRPPSLFPNPFQPPPSSPPPFFPFPPVIIPGLTPSPPPPPPPKSILPFPFPPLFPPPLSPGSPPTSLSP